MSNLVSLPHDCVFGADADDDAVVDDDISSSVGAEDVSEDLDVPDEGLSF